MSVKSERGIRGIGYGVPRRAMLIGGQRARANENTRPRREKKLRATLIDRDRNCEPCGAVGDILDILTDRD